MKTGGLLSCLLSAVVCGCWSEQLHDGAFDDAQWQRLKDELRPDLPFEPCTFPDEGQIDQSTCDALATAGHELLFRAELSSNGSVSCASCHDPLKGFVDSRIPNGTSLGATKWTKRNAMSLINTSLKRVYAPAGAAAYTWSGQYTSAADVLELAIIKPMATTDVCFAQAIANNPPARIIYTTAFGPPGVGADTCNKGDTPLDSATIVANVRHAFEAYEARLISMDAPFDKWLAGDDTAIGEDAKRGFAVFVGSGTCLECHSGPLFTDFKFHVTGVAAIPQTPDNGRQDVTMDPADAGAFMTAPLRNIAQTGPYMHDGTSGSLADVIEFYRRGGDTSGFAGTKDPRIVPLDISDDEAHDLEAFLRTLTGKPIDAKYTCIPGAKVSDGGCP